MVHVCSRAAKEKNQEKEQEEEEESKIPEEEIVEAQSDIKPYNKLMGFELKKQIIYALLAKKVSYAMNNWGLQLGIVSFQLLRISEKYSMRHSQFHQI